MAQIKVQKRSKRRVREAARPGEIVVTTGYSWWEARPVVGGHMVVRPGRTAVRALVPAAVRVFLPQLFVFRWFLLFFCFIILMYLDLLDT